MPTKEDKIRWFHRSIDECMESVTKLESKLDRLHKELDELSQSD